MKIIMLGAPEPEKELRQRKLQKNTVFLIFLQEIFSEPTSRTEQNLVRRQRLIWIRDSLYQMNWLLTWLWTE